MHTPASRAAVGRLKELSKEGKFRQLAQEAEALATSPDASALDRAVGRVLWAYALLRKDAHVNQARAKELLAQSAAQLPELRNEHSETADWATLTAGMAWQLLNDHQAAVVTFDKLLDIPDLDLAPRTKGAFSRAFSLYSLGRADEAAETYKNLGQYIDDHFRQDPPLSVRRDRQRIRLNLADHYLDQGQLEAAQAELFAVDMDSLTPLMAASCWTSQARVALMTNRWEDAEELANRAYGAALDVNFNPLRIDALGVLVAVAARQNRREEQLRLVVEMASLLQAK